jgi:hypothetical protein
MFDIEFEIKLKKIINRPKLMSTPASNTPFTLHFQANKKSRR